MWKKFRVAAVAVTAIASLVLAGCGGGAEPGDSAGTTIKVALNQTETHPSFVALKAFGEKLKADTDGRWNLEVYPNS